LSLGRMPWLLEVVNDVAFDIETLANYLFFTAIFHQYDVEAKEGETISAKADLGSVGQLPQV